MDTAASVIAVVQITEQVLSLCYEYAKGVKDAPANINSLRDELTTLKAVLDGADALLKGPHKEKLKTSQQLSRSLAECKSQLDKLSKRLDTKAGKVRRHLFSKIRLKWPLESKEVEKAVQSLHKHRENLSASLTIDQTAIVLDSFERIDDNERIQILDWMSSIQYGTHHVAISEKRTMGTCEWLIQRETFCQWENEDASVIMWLKGSPGAGKTYLTSCVIDHVQSRLQTATDKQGFAYFYCNRNDDERRKPLSVLQSYTRQLAAVAGQSELMQKRLRSLWLESRIKAQDLGMESCKKHILSSINLYDRTTLVLDALDECNIESRMALIEAIKYLLDHATKPLRVFISSRPDVSLFQGVPTIEIQATDNQDDIRKFVHEEIVKHQRWHDMPPSLREHIETTILAQSQGMFQWAYLQISQILGLQTSDAIQRRLGKLPKGLDKAYKEIYDEIASGDDSERAIATRAFMWVACAIKPLDEEQLLDAVRFDPDDVTRETEKVSTTVLLILCRNLLVFDRQREVWRFSHLSVTEYFETHHWTLDEAHGHAAKVCLGLLMKPVVDVRFKSIPYRDEESASFLLYYHMNWVHHVRLQERKEPDARLPGLLMDFLGSPTQSSSYYTAWYDYIRTQFRALRNRRRNGPFSDTLPEDTPVFLICRYSLFTVLDEWWRSTLDLSQTNKDGETTLMLAAKDGRASSCKTIVSRGVDVNAQARGSGTALIVAASFGHREVVQCLIDLGATVNVALQEDSKYGSALIAAVYNGQEDVVRCLLQNGAFLNGQVPGGKYGSALAAASQSGHLEIAKYLVSCGADVDLLLSSGNYGSALAAASWSRDLELVEYLVGCGADVNLLLSSGEYGSALAVASRYGHLKIVECLVGRGADVNLLLSCGEYGSALVAASRSGHLELVEYLVGCGADVNLLLSSGNYGSALAAASWSRDLELVEYLVGRGADVNLLLSSGNYGSALAAAAFGGVDTVRYLVNKGAAVDTVLRCGNFGTALTAAAHQSYGGYDLLKCLLDNGASIQLVPDVGEYGSPLVSAVVRGKIGSVRLLLDRGAQIDQELRCGRFGSPLCAAVVTHNIQMVTYLLERGADVNFLPSVGCFGSALATAVRFRLGDCVAFLLSKGADVHLELKTGGYKTAMLAAEAADCETRDEYTNGNLYYRQDSYKVDKDNARILKLLREHVEKGE